MRGRKLLIPILGLLIIPGAAVATTYAATSNQTRDVKLQDSWSDVDVKSQYNFHDEIAISDCTYTKDGNSYTSSHLLTFPNGKKTDATSVLLDQVGNYSLIYTSIVDGKVYTNVKRFNVKYGAFYFDTTKSSAEYVSEGPEALVYDALQENPVIQTAKGAPGLMVNLAKDDAFHVTKHFDFKNLTMNDILVKGYIVPSNQGAADFTTLTLKFTDSKDPSIFLRCSYFAYQINSQGGWSFAGAGGNDQQICGWLESQKSVYKGEGTGASMQTSFAAYRYDTLATPNTAKYLKYDQNPFQMSYNSSEMIVYGESNRLICDLDNSLYFDKFWSGFPSGKADLTITADGYSGSSGTIVLTNLLGNDLSNLNFEDTTGPEIVLESEYEDLPNGLVGKAYSIPKATSFDDYSRECNVKTEVVYNFAGANPVNISVEDGTFTPKKMGPYAIRYVSTDESNNQSVLTKVVNVYDELPEIAFDLPNSRVSNAEVGDTLVIDSPINLTGGSGNKTYVVNASLGDKIIPINGNTFIPDDIGEWTITYSAIDYLGQVKSISYKINVKMSREYALKGNLELLNYYISGSNYLLPEVELFHKNGDAVEVVIADIVVKDVNGTNTVKSGTTFIPKVENNGDSIVFSISPNGSNLFSQTVKGIAPFEDYTQGSSTRSVLNITNYFEFDNCSANLDSLTDEGMKVDITGSNGGFKFVKPLNKEKLSFVISQISSRNINAEIDIKLVDSYDSSKTVTIKAVTEDMQLVYRYGESSFVAENSFMNPAASKINLQFDNKKIAIGSFSNVVNTFDNGQPFNGFNNDVYVEITFKSFNANDYLFIQSINNHEVNKNKSDKFAPEIVVTESFELEHEINEIFKIPAAYAKDVLSPNVDFSVTMTSSSGEFLTSTDGVVLNNAPFDSDTFVKLSNYGDYKITYTYSESTDFLKSPNIENYTLTITVNDKKAPVLTITSDYQSEVKVGEYIVVPDYIISDNVTPVEEIVRVVTVTDPDGKRYYLDATCDADRNIDPLTGKPVAVVNAFKTAQAGKHIVKITIYDKAGNSAAFSYVVEAKEAK